jgi:parallel beta-helix repeat protein
MPVSMREILETPSVSEGVNLHGAAYATHVPFNITSNADFETLGFPGNGSEANPYRIQNLNITSANSTCIWVMNTTSHFIIEDCLLVSPVSLYTATHAVHPITLTNVSNGRVQKNRFLDSYAAVSGYFLSNCTIADNTFSVLYQGVSLWYSNSTTIFNNSQGYEPCSNAITMLHCTNCTASLNEFKNITNSGISAYGIYDTHITNNRLTASTSDLAFTWSGIEIRGGNSCSIAGNTLANFGLYGIDVYCAHCLIESNNITASGTSISVEVNFGTVRNNVVTGGLTCIEMIQANDTDVYGNTLSGRRGHYEVGIAAHWGNDCEIFSNNISLVYFGIYLQGSTGYNISGNLVSNARYGFAFGWYSAGMLPEGPFANCNIVDNVFDTGGVYPLIENYGDWDFDTITFEGNTVNDGAIGLFCDISGQIINGADFAQLLLVSCSAVTVSGGDFSGVRSDRTEPYYDPGQASAIVLLNCTSCTLSGLNFHNNTIGVNLQYSTECNVTGSSGYLNAWRGISVSHSTLIRISDTDISHSPRGIEISLSHNCRISGSTITENEEGVVLLTSYSCHLSGNLIFDNRDGILLVDSDGTNLDANAVYWNDRGILLNSTSDCIIIGNNIYNNTRVGICLTAGSNLNDIYGNIFAFNAPNSICEGASNHWDNQVDTGNSWSDYSGEGPYVIDENDQDNYPSIYTRTTTIGGPGGLNLLQIGAAAGVVGLAALIILVTEKRRVRVVD